MPRFAFAAPAALALMAAGALQAQPDRPPREAVEREIVISRDGQPPRVMTWRAAEREDATRAWLGITTGGSGGRAGAGLIVHEVVSGSPAEQAGILEGTRLTSINGTSLTLDPADAEDPAMEGVLQRRLTRVLRDVKPGTEVELGVLADGRTRTVKVRTIAASEAPGRDRAAARRAEAERAVIGVMLGATPSARDTLGVFVQGVTAGGPAERAGIVEGERIAAINGQDLRVPKADAGDEVAQSARAARLTRVLRGVKAGDEVELRVVVAGRSRTVKVRTAKAGDADGRGEDVEIELRRDGPDGPVRPARPDIEIDLREMHDELRELGPMMRGRIERGLRMMPRIEVRRDTRITI